MHKLVKQKTLFQHFLNMSLVHWFPFRLLSIHIKVGTHLEAQFLRLFIFCLATSPHRCVLARFITEMTGPRHNNKDYFCTMFSILKALCACTLPPLTCRCSKVDVSQIHMVNPVNDLKIAHIIACLGIFLWVQNLKLDI